MRCVSTGIFAALVTLAATSAAMNDSPLPDPALSSVTATYSNIYSGCYNPGNPYDFVTVCPAGDGETFADNGITIKVALLYSDNEPVVGLPASDIRLYSPDLCICTDGNMADGPTNAQGETTFTGTLAAGGCATSLDVYVEGIYFGTVQARINSVDTGAASPCSVDSQDIPSLSTALGTCNDACANCTNTAGYDVCTDYNETGYVDSGDLTYFSRHRTHACQD